MGESRSTGSIYFVFCRLFPFPATTAVWGPTCHLSILNYTAKNYCNTKNSKQIFQEKDLPCHSPNSTFTCLWAIYIFPRSIRLFCCRKDVDQSWKFINRSQSHECGKWVWGRAIPRKGLHKGDLRCSATLYRWCGIAYPYDWTQKKTWLGHLVFNPLWSRWSTC